MRAVLGLFFLTGFAGLAYEVVWLRMLVRVFGSTSFATSNVLAVFMGGMAAGAWLAGRRAKGIRSPLRAYGLVEAGLAACAAAATVLLSLLPAAAVFLGSGEAGSFSTLLVRSALSAAVLAAPTLLMGASFPLLAEHSARRQGEGGRGEAGHAALYGVNALGAVAGVLATGYWLLGAWGERRTALLAVAVNAAVGLGALWAARGEAAAAPPATVPAPKKRDVAKARPARGVLAERMALLMALSGFAALGLEVLWTRLLILLLGNSVYAFSAMLAAYLLGVGTGSLACVRWLRKDRARAPAFATLQLLAAAAILVSLEVFRAQGLAHGDASFLYSPIRSASDFAGLVATGAGIVFPVTFLYGMIFPLSIAIVDPAGSGEGAGRVYALNTVGSVLGSLACGFALIPLLGTRATAYALAGLHVAIAALAEEWSGSERWGSIGAAAGVVLLLSALRPDPFLDIVRARLLKRGAGTVSFHLEGPSSTVTGFDRGAAEHLLLINGIIVSGKGDLGRFMAHFPLILQEAPRRALVICLGAGNTFRAAVDHGVEVDLSELEPEVVAAFSRLWPDHAAYLQNPRAHVHVNDGRNFLLTSRTDYDLVVIDGTPPIFSAGTVNLYSREMIELAHRRLTKTGVLALWVPLPCFERDFWTIARNFTDVFGRTLAWGQPNTGLGGVLLMGSDAPLAIDPALISRRAAARGLLAANPWLNASLMDPRHLVTDAALRARTAGVPGVTDDRPLTEFPLPVFASGAPLRKEPDFLPFGAR